MQPVFGPSLSGYNNLTEHFSEQTLLRGLFSTVTKDKAHHSLLQDLLHWGTMRWILALNPNFLTFQVRFQNLIWAVLFVYEYVCDEPELT